MWLLKNQSYYPQFLGYTYTDGVEALCTDYECFWFVDLIASYKTDRRLVGQEFKSWTLTRTSGDEFKVTCEDGNHNVILTQDIPYSDFKDDKCTMWEVNGVVFLPSEY